MQKKKETKDRDKTMCRVYVRTAWCNHLLHSIGIFLKINGESKNVKYKQVVLILGKDIIERISPCLYFYGMSIYYPHNFVNI